jgi:RNA polymerase sigma-70 factor, ECF subfamily
MLFVGKDPSLQTLDPAETVMLSRLQAEPWRLDAQPLHAEPANRLGFDDIYEKWFDEVARWVRALGGPDADRDDLVQDIFLIVYRRLPDFDGNNVPGWLYQIARRKVRDHRRLLWVKEVFSRSVPLSERLCTRGSNPADSYEAKERSLVLEQLLGQLSADQRAAFVLFEIEGHSGQEIARIQGVPINTVWARIHKARKKLLARLSRLEHLGRGART